MRQAPLFAALDDEAAAALQASTVEVRLSKGQDLFLEGEPGDRMFVITEGKVKLGHTASDGRESLLAILGPGELLGELSLFDPGPRTATATALTDATLIALGHSALRPWLTGRPEVALLLLAAGALQWRAGERRSSIVLGPAVTMALLPSAFLVWVDVWSQRRWVRQRRGAGWVDPAAGCSHARCGPMPSWPPAPGRGKGRSPGGRW